MQRALGGSFIQRLSRSKLSSTAFSLQKTVEPSSSDKIARENREIKSLENNTPEGVKIQENLKQAVKQEQADNASAYETYTEQGHSLDDVITVDRWRGNIIEENRFFSGQVNETDLRAFQRNPNLIRQLWPKPDFSVQKMSKFITGWFCEKISYYWGLDL